MAEAGEINNVNLSGIQFTEDGRAMNLHLIGMTPPYGTTIAQCQTVFSIRWDIGPDADFPYYVGELIWHELSQKEKQALLEKADYSIFDSTGQPAIATRRIIHVHLDGDIYGELLAGGFRLEEQVGK